MVLEYIRSAKMVKMAGGTVAVCLSFQSSYSYMS